MRIKTFNTLLTDLFQFVSIDPKKLQLNGSFMNSYWASDIDLYEPVSQQQLSTVVDKVNTIKQKHQTTDVKVAFDDGSVSHFQSKDKPFAIDKKPHMIKIDIIVYMLVFPIECSIIYDFDQSSHSTKDVLSALLDDITNPKYNLYKKFKRLSSIASLIGYDHLFRPITEHTEIGLLYLSNERLKTLKLANNIDKADMDKYKAWIAEDLRKYGHSITDDLDAVVNKEIMSVLHNSCEKVSVK